MKLTDKLPRSYKELNYKKYVKILNTIPDERPDGCDELTWSRLVHLTTLSILLDMTVEDVENCKASEVFEAIQAISFMDVNFVREKTSFKVKDINELSFDEFTAYQTLRVDQWNNLGTIISLMTKDISPEQVDALSIYDAMQIFFLSRRKTKRFLTRLKYSLLKKLIGQMITSCRFWNSKKK